MKERRRAARYGLVLPVAVSGVPALEGMLQGQTRDFSAWGIYFTTDRWIELGTKFKFSIMLPEAVMGGTRVSVNGEATVVRVEEEENSAGKHVGIAALVENREIVRPGEWGS